MTTAKSPAAIREAHPYLPPHVRAAMEPVRNRLESASLDSVKASGAWSFIRAV
jgi:hypothetical protein